VNLNSAALFVKHICSLEEHIKSIGQFSDLVVEQLKETPNAAVLLKRL
jgi:hypothetical protein